jgi:hypothetical protein
MSDERSFEQYDLRTQADTAIYEISKFLDKPEYADHAMENLFNIALLAAIRLNEVRRSNPELAKSFASDRTQWPYWLSPGVKGWKKDGVPEEIRDILYNLGLGEADGSWPIKGAEDLIGRAIKYWRSGIADIRSDPDADPSFSEYPEVPSPYGEYYHKHVLDLPDLGSDKPSCRAWAKAIFDLIFIKYGLSDQIPISFKDEGVQMVTMLPEESELFDRSHVAYSLFRPCSNTFMEKKLDEAQFFWDECYDKAVEIAGNDATSDTLDAKTEEIFDRRYSIVPPHKMGDHPTDEEFRREAIQFIMGRLKGMVP